MSDARQASPGSADEATQRRRFYMAWQNQPQPAIEAFRRAMRLSPLDPLGHMFTGGLAFALEWADRCLREQPRFTSVLRIKVAAYARLGRLEEAQNCLRRVLDVQPGFSTASSKALLEEMAMPPEIVSLYKEGLRKAGASEV